MAKTIKNTGPTQKQIDAKVIARTLGAERVGIRIDTRQGPISLFSLRQFLVNRLRSSGGRPALAGTTERRNKIPLFDEDWVKLKKIAKYYKEKEGINVSPGQIASALIHTDISKIEISKNNTP
ncbi:MAG: hypothetical protein ISS45_02630 [Candidatus Omnitrophica bacterium]|nr:hypothetical protein [Candidatus Omnitrophota bacterium]